MHPRCVHPQRGINLAVLVAARVTMAALRARERLIESGVKPCDRSANLNELKVHRYYQEKRRSSSVISNVMINGWPFGRTSATVAIPTEHLKPVGLNSVGNQRNGLVPKKIQSSLIERKERSSEHEWSLV